MSMSALRVYGSLTAGSVGRGTRRVFGEDEVLAPRVWNVATVDPRSIAIAVVAVYGPAREDRALHLAVSI
jgi:hypothetical protein